MAVTPRLEPAWSLDMPITQVLFWKLVDERSLARLRRESWPTDVAEIRDGGSLLSTRHQSLAGGGLQEAVYDNDGVVSFLTLSEGSIRVLAAAETDKRVEEHLQEVLADYPRSVYANGLVPVTFWSYSPHGPRSVTRKIAVSPWETIVNNYAGPAQGRLAEMMDRFRPSHGGQLVLWQGEPGTGKTHALRALAWEWREWAELHYVVDPEVLFGDKADYLLDVLLYESHSFGDDGEEARERWRVLVLEDTGEILSADARQRVGQALSRLLNVVDGMIGQGLKILVLVTTNEELKKLHPAVARPGRCAMQISFDPLSGLEAHRWAVAHGIDPENAPTDEHSLADLYALVENFATREQTRSVGFAAV